MQQLLDFVPILAFAIAFVLGDIYWATGTLMVAVTAQLAIYRLLNRPIGTELKLTFWMSLLFGGLTLLLRNELFVQWKPTAVNWGLALLLLGGMWVGKRNFVKTLLGQHLELPDDAWRHLNYGWAAGFFLAGVLNLVVAYNFSMEFWVAYKLFGGIALTLAYMILTFVYLHRRGLLEQLADAPATDRNGADP